MTRQAKPPGVDAVDAEARRVLHRWQVTRPDDRLAHLVKDTLRLLDRSLRTRLARFGVSMGHWPFLRALWERDGLTQRELSREVGVMDPTTFAAVRSMEALGYVVRRPVPGDRRKRDVFLTAQGRALEARLVPLAREINTLAVRGVSRADVAATRRTLLAMLGNLAADEASADTPKRRSRA